LSFIFKWKRTEDFYIQDPGCITDLFLRHWRMSVMTERNHSSTEHTAYSWNIHRQELRVSWCCILFQSVRLCDTTAMTINVVLCDSTTEVSEKLLTLSSWYEGWS
jgi:hypothetical protein